MKITYHFMNGDRSEIEVPDEIGTVIIESRRQEENYERKTRYHCPYSVDKLLYEGEDYADKSPTPDALYEEKEDEPVVQAFFAALTDTQRRRLKKRMDGKNITEIAKEEGATYMSVKETFTQLKNEEWEDYMKNQYEYDAIIIGFGKGGKTLATTLGSVGKRTLLIERSPNMYGGTCINVGCIPTKFLAHKARNAQSFATFAQKQSYYRKTIEEEILLTKNLASKNLAKVENAPNVTVVTGFATLRSATQVEVRTKDGSIVFEGKQIFLNTGSVPIIPPIDGLKDTPCVVTSEELLRQSVLPKRLVIIGGGYIGIEFASIYADFGSQVTILQKDSLFLPREEREIANAISENLESRGVKIISDIEIKSLAEENGKPLVVFQKGEARQSLEADTVLVATGRRPNTDGLGLENAGVALSERGGVVTNEYLQTTNPSIYAMGDVVGGLQFTYISLDDFRIVRSAVIGDGSYTRGNRGVVPYSLFTNPPFSRVGLSEREAIERGYSVKVARMSASAIPKALVLEQPTGLLKVILDERSGLILGAHLFCEEAHEMINLIKLAMDAKIKYSLLRDMIFTHPTMSEAFNELFNV